MKRRLIASAVSVLVSGASATAQQGSPAPKPRVVPSAPITHPSYAKVLGKRMIDIPEADRNAGHSGGATWTATIGPDGILRGLTLKDSSNSPAIDAAAKAWAERARYIAATDAAGTRVTGTVDVHLSYEPWDRDNVSGLARYRCGELVRDADWFSAANAGRQRIFWLENAYTSMPSLRLMQQGVIQSRPEREVSRATALKEWKAIIGRCRKSPERPLLELVEDRDFYRGIVESF